MQTNPQKDDYREKACHVHYTIYCVHHHDIIELYKRRTYGAKSYTGTKPNPQAYLR